MTEREKMMRLLGTLGLDLHLVQTEMNGTKHYKDDKGNRVILYIDGVFSIEEADC